MSAKPKDWPYFAASERDLTAEDLQAIVDYQRQLQKLAREQEVIQIAMSVLDLAQVSLRRLERVGARTVPR